MTLLEVFNAMDEADRPEWLRHDGIGFQILPPTSSIWYPTHPSAAESAICWAMVKALRDNGYEPRFDRYCVYLGGDDYEDLHAAYRAMKEAR